MTAATATELREKTKDTLSQLEQSEPFLLTRNGRTIGRLSPIAAAEAGSWNEIMRDVWRAHESTKSSDRLSKPVLQELKLRRR
jgi:antitoxin (DNA-binding transcriptional repressor) of toxin-antitoxin stability system